MTEARQHEINGGEKACINSSNIAVFPEMRARNSLVWTHFLLAKTF